MDIESNIRDSVIQNKKSYAKMLKCRKEMYEYILQKTSFLGNDVQLSTRLFYMFNHIGSKLTCCGCGCEINRDFVALSPYEPKKICCSNCSASIVRKNLMFDIENDHTIFDENESKKIEDEIRKGLDENSYSFKKRCWSMEKSYILKYLNFKYPRLREGGYSWYTKYFWFYRNITEFPKCEICGKVFEKDVFSFTVGYPTVCSDCKIEQMHRRSFELYGTSDPGNSKEGRVKSRQTRLLKYNDENYTNRDKCKKTCQEKFGGNAPACSPEVRLKMERTTYERHGVRNVFCRGSKIRDNIISKLKKQHNVENFSQLDSTKEKIGVSEKTAFYESLENDIVTPMFSVGDYCSLSLDDRHQREFDWKCKKCGNIFSSKIIYCGGVEVDGILTHAYCPICYKELEHIVSRDQKEIVEYIESIYDGKVVENDRSVLNPKELDIYIPDKNLAIEYDGLYWHSEGNGHGRKSHLKKTLDCEAKGIHLVHVFENEWLHKKDIVKSRIRNLLGLHDQTIYARRCTVKEIDSKTSLTFQDINHIQGHVKSKVNLGMFNGDELVGVMTFSHPRFNKKYDWELVRFCNKCGYHIPGGASKLLKHFERTYHPKSIVSYADRRWSMGKLYSSIGFRLDNISPPNYWYFKRGKLESRVKYQKHKLKHLLETYDESKSEVQNMHDNGYGRIFDCGNLVFVKNYEEH